MAVTAWGQVYIQPTMPAEPPVQVGSLWCDTSGVATLKICTSITPYTFATISGGGGGSAPDDAEYIVAALNGTLTAERLATDAASITWDFSVAGVAKAKRAALTGDVTASADSNVTTIAADAVTTAKILNDAVTYAKMQNVSAASRLLGRGSAAGSGDPEEITLGSNLSMSGTTLNATDTDTGITQLTGDVTAGPGSGSQAATIANNAVTTAKINNGAVTEAKQTLADNTTNDASTSAHGYAPKATAPAAGLENVLAIGNGETAYTDKALFDTTNPTEVGTVAPGTALIAARRDHVHPNTAATQSAGDSSTKIATTSFVTTAVANAIAGVNPAVAVRVATAAVLPNTPSYNNGVGGVGATLTTATTNTALVVDGVTIALNDRVLVKNQASAFQNGVYFLSTLQGVGIAWVLTRALDYNQPSDMNSSGAIPVYAGTVNVDTQWVQTSTVATVGTDAVTFTQFSLNPTTIVVGPASATDGHLAVFDGTSGKLIKDGGAVPASGGAPQTIYSTIFETAARFRTVKTGASAVANFTDAGLVLDTVTTVNGSALADWIFQGSDGTDSPFTTFPSEFGCLVYLNTIGSDIQTFWGLGAPTVASAGITYTVNHIGFKLVRAASGPINLFATQADGTETASAALTTVAAGNDLDLALRVNNANSVEYWWRKNGGAWSVSTELTTHIPTASSVQTIRFAVSNANVAVRDETAIGGAFYKR